MHARGAVLPMDAVKSESSSSELMKLDSGLTDPWIPGSANELQGKEVSGSSPWRCPTRCVMRASLLVS